MGRASYNPVAAGILRMAEHKDEKQKKKRKRFIEGIIEPPTPEFLMLEIK